MAFTDVINDYTQGATGTVTDINGLSVGYTVTDGATTINRANHGSNSARIRAQGQDTVTVTFDNPVVGGSVTFQGSDNVEFYNVIIDGVVVDLFALVASGDVTLVNAGTVATHTVNPDGTISGGQNSDGSIGQLIFNFPVTSFGVVGAGGPSAGNFDGVEIGVEATTFDVVCFTSGTTIMTNTGPRLIETLRVDDLVRTMDNGDQPIRWIGSRSFASNTLGQHANLRPVRITAGALGNGLPKEDLSVSRQHRILVSSKIVRRMFDVREVLIPAIKLTELPGIYVDESVTDVRYFHIMFDAHEIVFAQSIPSESFYGGPDALKTLSVESMAEIITIFPELTKQGYTQNFARTVPTGKKQKQLVQRHFKNQKAVLELHL